MPLKDIDRVSITHRDSANPDRVVIDIKPGAWGDGASLDLSVVEAADLAERLLYAVRMSGYELVARKRTDR